MTLYISLHTCVSAAHGGDTAGTPVAHDSLAVDTPSDDR